MSFPHKASVRLLVALAFMSLASLPLRHASAQTTQAARTKQTAANGKIVFQSTQGGDGSMSDIYVMDADGKHQTRLTESPTIDDVNPLWSPQGDQIAFLSDHGNGYEIYLMNPDGTNQRPLRTPANGGPVVGWNFQWSPDGSKLAYEGTGDAQGNIYVAEVKAPGGGDSVIPPHMLNAARPVGSRDFEPNWSPNGSKLVVRHTSCDFCGVTELCTMNADGSNVAQLTNAPGFEDNPHWSPDGSLIVYEADRGGSGVYVRRSDGTGAETQLSVGINSAGSGVWSPDGSLVAFVSDRNNVYVVRPDGTGLMLLTDVLANGGGALFWSPDGTKVAFHNFNNAVDLYVVNADGSRKATNYTKTRRDDEFAFSWQKLAAQ
jgi:TolB protein